MKQESDFFMKIRILFLLVIAVLVSSCTPTWTAEQGDAEEVLEEILNRFEFSDGVVYSDRNDADFVLSDAMIERMFSDGYGVPAFEYVVSCAAYLSRRYSDHEIVVIKLCDKSHREEMMQVCRRRAAKKENAVVYADGVYVYLICTDRNEEILDYIK